jgi:hypothetical protein
VGGTKRGTNGTIRRPKFHIRVGYKKLVLFLMCKLQLSEFVKEELLFEKLLLGMKCVLRPLAVEEVGRMEPVKITGPYCVVRAG